MSKSLIRGNDKIKLQKEIREKISFEYNCLVQK